MRGFSFTVASGNMLEVASIVVTWWIVVLFAQCKVSYTYCIHPLISIHLLHVARASWDILCHGNAHHIKLYCLSHMSLICIIKQITRKITFNGVDDLLYNFNYFFPKYGTLGGQNPINPSVVPPDVTHSLLCLLRCGVDKILWNVLQPTPGCVTCNLPQLSRGWL